jgi:uncharacterized protein (TIGR02596 family)
MTKNFEDHERAASGSFTLLETLLVVTVVAIVLAIVISAYNSSAQATAVTTGATMIDDALTQARAGAIARNTTVEVRIYDLPTSSSGGAVYDALQLHWVNATNSTPPMSSAVFLPSWVVIDATATHSPLIAQNPETATPDANDARLNSQTRVFHFLPDGTTDLNPATNWFMTVRVANQSDPANFPSNWACIRVDPTTGLPQIYRP